MVSFGLSESVVGGPVLVAGIFELPEVAVEEAFDFVV